jgi:N-acetylglucosamine kinase-like BadF-type ATPase
MLGIGFDSGGTRTTYALAGADGLVEAVGNEAGYSIADARDPEALGAAVDWIMDVIEDQADDEIAVWISAAGFSSATAKAIKARFDPRIRSLARTCEREERSVQILIANDGVGLLKAPPLNGAGVIAIVGTGSVVMGAHPDFPDGVVQRGGYEWVVSDEGSGVWMTLQSMRLVLRDIQEHGVRDYRSALLDRMADYFGVTDGDLGDIPMSHRSMARADAVARKMSESRADLKRSLARFVYPNIFDLASLESGRSHDRIAADVISQSVGVIVDSVRAVSDQLAAFTADEPNLRTAMPLIVGGNIAANPLYDQQLRVQVSATCRYISSVEAIGSAANSIARLALSFLQGREKERRQIARSLDPLHPVLQLM